MGRRRRARHLEDAESDFAAHFIRNSATIEWTGETELARYVSDPSSTSVSAFAEVGFERNGVFFDGNGHLFGGDDGAAVPGVDGGPSSDAPAAAAPSPLTDLNELSESIRERVDGRLAAHPVLDKLPGLD